MSESRRGGEIIKDIVAGRQAGEHTESVFARGSNQKIDWRIVLRRFLGQVLEQDPVYTYPSRRLPGLIGVVPARRQRPGKARVLGVVDTSGSLDRKTLDMISAEFTRISRDAELIIVECDARVQAIYHFHTPLNRLKGRGETDLRPPLEEDFLSKYRPDVVLYAQSDRR